MSKQADKAWKVHLRKALDDLDAPISKLVLLGAPREIVIEAAGKAFDYWQRLRSWDPNEDDEEEPEHDVRH